MLFTAYCVRRQLINAVSPIDRHSICTKSCSSTFDNTDNISTVISTPGKAIRNAASAIPLAPYARFPRPVAISTGSAPGVILATITSLSYSLFSTIFWSSTTSLSITGIRAVPPPKPTTPILKIEAISLNSFCIFAFIF